MATRKTSETHTVVEAERYEDITPCPECGSRNCASVGGPACVHTGKPRAA